MSLTLKHFFRDQAHLKEILQSLPLHSCPFCHMIGTLICHGKLKGHGEDNYNKDKNYRGQRVICNARRKHRSGCGHTFSIVSAKILKNFCITAASCSLPRSGRKVVRLFPQ